MQGKTLQWVIKGELARGQRPGYGGERGAQVSQDAVDSWLNEVAECGIRSIVCLLDEDQLRFYQSLPTDLVSYYRQKGFAVEHVPARDHQSPPLSEDHLDRIWAAYNALQKPILVHCSAGVDRTGQAVDRIPGKIPGPHGARGRG